jgi:hypothetical protein
MGRFFMHLFKITAKPCKSRTLRAFPMAKFGGESSHHGEIASMQGGVAMVTVKGCSHVHQLLEILSVVGELPTSALSLIGNERTLKILIHKLESLEEIRVDNHNFHTKLFSVSGKRNARTIRLSKGALPILSAMDENAAGYYADVFGKRNFSGGEMHLDRNHRVAESVAMSVSAGFAYKPYALPRLSLTEKARRIPNMPCFYLARELKQTGNEELNKTCYSRFIGALFYNGGGYAVYNTRGSVMKWSAAGERKIVGLLTDVARMNAGLREIDSALLLGSDESVALRTIMESDKSRHQSGRMDRVYQHIYFIPLNADGIRLLKILTLPDWNEKLLDSLFEKAQRPKGFGFMEYDAYSDGKYVYSHLDGDLTRLIRFKSGLESTSEAFEILCYPWQEAFLQEYLGFRVKRIPIVMKDIEDALNIRPEEMKAT